MVSPAGNVQDHLGEIDIEIRALKRRVEAFSSGDTVRADAISGVIPAANAPTTWFWNGNLLGNGSKADFIEAAGVWISGTFVAGRAYYSIGAYAAGGGGGMSGTYFDANGVPLCFGDQIDLQQEWGVWISGSCAGGHATYRVGAYYQGGGGGASGTVAFYDDNNLFCEALAVDLEEAAGIWISGTCVDGGSKARYKIGAAGAAGGGDDILALAYAVAL